MARFTVATHLHEPAGSGIPSEIRFVGLDSAGRVRWHLAFVSKNSGEMICRVD